MDDVSIWHDLETDRMYVKGHGRKAEVDPLVIEAFRNELTRLNNECVQLKAKCERYESTIRAIKSLASSPLGISI